MQETWVRSLGQEGPLKKGMATHSSILAWRTPWTEEPGGWQPMGSQSYTTEWLFLSLSLLPLSVDLCCWHETNILNFWLLSPLVLVPCLPSAIFLRKYLCLFPLQSTLAGLAVGQRSPYFHHLKDNCSRTTTPTSRAAVNNNKAADSFSWCPVVPCIDLKQGHLS